MSARAPLTHASLAQGLLAAVRAQDFGHTADNTRAGAAVRHFPSIDLAVVVFAPPGSTRLPVWANVLFSREHPDGVVAQIGSNAGALQGLRFDADQRDQGGNSIAWATDSDWTRMRWRRLAGSTSAPLRFVAPYPASLLKLMVAVGVGLAVDEGLCAWPAALEPMIVVSDNDATTACVALLHRLRRVASLNARFAALNLPTLQLNGTQPNGGWMNGDGAGVGQIHMTAWDTARLLWLLDADAPTAPWLPPTSTTPPLLQAATRDHLRAVLARQELDEILSSGALKAVPGWVQGGPDAPAFAHKTGTTENYASDAGIVQTVTGSDGLPACHYTVAVLTSLGSRYAPHEDCATTWRLPALGAALHRLVAGAA
jgi:hypothetical protein